MAKSLHAKAGRLPSGVDGRDPSANRRGGQSRSVGGIATILAGAALADLGSRPCRSNVQVDPKANGATASRKGCRGPAELRPVVSRRGVVQCLSCMRRNGARAVLRGGGAGDSTSLPDIEGESSTEMGRPRRICRLTCRWRTRSPYRESGLTSLGCSVTREPRPTDSGRQADMSAAEMLAGAAPGRALWRTIRRLQVRIVKAVAQAAASREGRL